MSDDLEQRVRALEEMMEKVMAVSNASALFGSVFGAAVIRSGGTDAQEMLDEDYSDSPDDSEAQKAFKQIVRDLQERLSAKS